MPPRRSPAASAQSDSSRGRGVQSAASEACLQLVRARLGGRRFSIATTGQKAGERGAGGRGNKRQEAGGSAGGSANRCGIVGAVGGGVVCRKCVRLAVGGAAFKKAIIGGDLGRPTRRYARDRGSRVRPDGSAALH